MVKFYVLDSGGYFTNLQMYALREARRMWEELEGDYARDGEQTERLQERCVFAVAALGLSVSQLLGQNNPNPQDRVPAPTALLGRYSRKTFSRPTVIPWMHMNIFEVLVVVMGLGSGGSSHGMVEESRPQVDTVAVLQAAFEHHFEEVPLDSAALNVESSFGSDIGVRVDILERLAENVGVPLARYSEVHSCDGPRISRRCSLSGMKQLLGVRLQSLEEGRAEVGVFSFHEWREGRVDVGGALYAVEYQDNQWVVTERLMVWAT